MNTLSKTNIRKRDGFTLIELLTVIAIIGILAGILIPVIGSARSTALKAKSKARFSNYATAIVSYKSEYGYYPTLGLANGIDNDGVNLKSYNDQFYKSLGAIQYADGFTTWNPSPTERKDLNPKMLAFYSFGDADIATAPISLGGETIVPGDLIDDFYNPNIFVAVENRDGIVVVPTGTGANTEEISTEVAVWSEASGSADFENIYSWR